MFLINAYRFVLNQLVTAMTRAAELKQKKVDAIEVALKKLQAERIETQTEIVKLDVEAVRLKAFLG